RRWKSVNPRSNDQLLPRAGGIGLAVLADTHEVVQGPGGKEVVPAAYIECRHADLAMMRYDAGAFPIVAAVGMSEPIVEIRRGFFARQEGKLAQRQMRERAAQVIERPHDRSFLITASVGSQPEPF